MLVIGTQDVQSSALPTTVTELWYVPHANANGVDTFTYSASDCGGDRRRAPTPTTVTIDIAAVNDAPFTEFVEPPVANEGQTTLLSLQGSDVDDASGATLRYFIEAPPIALTSPTTTFVGRSNGQLLYASPTAEHAAGDEIDSVELLQPGGVHLNGSHVIYAAGSLDDCAILVEAAPGVVAVWAASDARESIERQIAILRDAGVEELCLVNVPYSVRDGDGARANGTVTVIVRRDTHDDRDDNVVVVLSAGGALALLVLSLLALRPRLMKSLERHPPSLHRPPHTSV